MEARNLKKMDVGGSSGGWLIYEMGKEQMTKNSNGRRSSLENVAKTLMCRGFFSYLEFSAIAELIQQAAKQ